MQLGFVGLVALPVIDVLEANDQARRTAAGGAGVDVATLDRAAKRIVASVFGSRIIQIG
jgi:hypothetical protein